MFYLFAPDRSHPQEKEILAEIARRFPIKLKRHFHSKKFVYYEPKMKIYGGLFLRQEYLANLLPMAYLRGENPLVWVCDEIFFESENEDINECLEDFNWHYQNFFRSLFEQLTSFAIANVVEEIFLWLPEEDLEDTCVFGKWLLDWITHFDSDIVLSHLTFDRQSYANYAKQWEEIDHRP